MTIDETFEAIHQLLRGSRCAINLVNVRGLYDAGNLADAHAGLLEIRNEYENSRRSTLEAEPPGAPANKDAKQLKKRHDKAVDALELMDQLVSQLHRLSRIKPPTKPATPAPLSQTEHVTLPPEETHSLNDDSLRLELANVQSEAEVIRILGMYCDLASIEPTKVFLAGERFVVLSQGQATVVEVDEPPLADQSIRLKNWLSQQRLLPIAIERFQLSASKGRVQKMVLRTTESTNPGPITPPKSSPSPNSEPKDAQEIVSATADRDKILDMGAFTQLLDAAQRSGIVPGSGIIIQVRDCEYRLGRYNKALQMMETLYTSFVGAEMQRNQRLQIEENEITSGRKKMSQRDLQAKRIRDNQNTQAVERAKVRFQRVLEGLRGLLPLESHYESE